MQPGWVKSLRSLSEHMGGKAPFLGHIYAQTLSHRDFDDHHTAYKNLLLSGV